jgi:TRAP-type C4-dicarboxylate transport system substrate-binding protein
MGLFMSNKVLQKISKEYQDLIIREARKAAVWEREYITKRNASAIEEMQQKYKVTVTRPDKKVLLEKGRPIQDAMAVKLGLQDLLAKVRETPK